MAGKGRPPGFSMGPEHRAKIANSQILNRLIGHVEGSVEMTQTQVTAGVALLKKVMPDMVFNQHEGTGAGGEIVFRTVYEAK